jgi:hypothetical protein
MKSCRSEKVNHVAVDLNGLLDLHTAFVALRLMTRWLERHIITDL